MYKYTGVEQVKCLSLNRLIHGVLGHAPALILMICFCTVNVLHCCMNYLQILFHNLLSMKVCEINLRVVKLLM